MAGKRQHYVPRFLQRGFLYDPHCDAERTWLHRRGARARLVGIRDVGVGEYFYSKLRADGVETLDDVITAIEGGLDGELSALRRAPVDEPIDPKVAARLTTHLMLRTAHVRSVFEQGAVQIFNAAIPVLSDPNVVRDHIDLDKLGGAAAFQGGVDDALKSLPLDALAIPHPLARRMLSFMSRERFDSFFAGAGPMIVQALTEMTKNIPVQIREAHNKSLEAIQNSRWEERLAELSWSTQEVVGAVLPDCVVLAREKGQDFTPLLLSDREKVELVILPLSHDRILVGWAGVKAPIEVKSLNAGSVACSDSFFISRCADDGAGLSDLIGQRPAKAIRASVDKALSGFRRRTGGVKVSGIPVEPRVSETEDLASFSFSLTCLDFADSEIATRLGEIIKVIVHEMGRGIPLATLDGITFAFDYPAALLGLDRGDEAISPSESQPRDYGRPVAKSVQVFRGGESKSHIVIDSVIADWLLSDDEDNRTSAIHLILNMLADLGHTERYEAQLKGISVATPDEITRMLHSSVSAAPGSYFGARESAFCDPKAGERYATLVRDSLAAAHEAIAKARLAYRVSNSLENLLGEALPHISFVLTHAAQWLGHRDGLPSQDVFPGSSLPGDLKAYDLNFWLELFARDLRNLYDADGQFTSENIFALSRHVERLLWTVQICPWPMEDGTPYVSVPLGNDAALLEIGSSGDD